MGLRNPKSGHTPLLLEALPGLSHTRSDSPPHCPPLPLSAPAALAFLPGTGLALLPRGLCTGRACRPQWSLSNSRVAAPFTSSKSLLACHLLPRPTLTPNGSYGSPPCLPGPLTSLVFIFVRTSLLLTCHIIYFFSVFVVYRLSPNRERKRQGPLELGLAHRAGAQ